MALLDFFFVSKFQENKHTNLELLCLAGTKTPYSTICVNKFDKRKMPAIDWKNLHPS
jgi:hypothetical protein